MVLQASQSTSMRMKLIAAFGLCTWSPAVGLTTHVRGSQPATGPVYTVQNPGRPVVPVTPMSPPPAVPAAPVQPMMPAPPVVGFGAPEAQAAAAAGQAQMEVNMVNASAATVQGFVSTIDYMAYQAGRLHATSMLPKVQMAAAIAADPAMTTTPPSAAVQAEMRMATENAGNSVRATQMAAQANAIATQAVMEATTIAQQAHALAATAQQEQAAGSTYQAKIDMQSAHDMLYTASTRNEGALKFRRFAENVNSLVPVYASAAMQAQTNAFALGR